MIRILVPLDGSVSAEESIHHALRISRTFAATIELLQVVDTAHDDDANQDCVDQALSRHQARAYLATLCGRYARFGQTLTYKVAEGHAAEAVVDYVHAGHCDLLILTRYGTGDARNFATGGTAQKIASSVSVSVLLIDPYQPIDPQADYANVLVPIDDSKNADCAVAVASMIADISSASLSLMQATEDPQLPRQLPVTPQSRELRRQLQQLLNDEGERRLQEAAGLVPKHVRVTTRHALTHDPALAIESIAEHEGCDLIVLHSPPVSTVADRLYDPVCEAMIQYSHRPLFILRPSVEEGFGSNFRSVYLESSRLEAV